MASNRKLQEINMSDYFIDNTKKKLTIIKSYMIDIENKFKLLKNKINSYSFPFEYSNNTVEVSGKMIKGLENYDINIDDKKEEFIDNYNNLKERFKEFYDKINELYNNNLIIEIKEFNEIIYKMIYNLDEFDPPKFNNDSDSLVIIDSKLEEENSYNFDKSYNSNDYSENFYDPVFYKVIKESSKENNNIKCGKHSQNEGVFYCNHCGFIICDECEEIYKFGFDHKFEKIDEIKEKYLNKKNKFLESFMNIIILQKIIIKILIKYNNRIAIIF